MSVFSGIVVTMSLYDEVLTRGLFAASIVDPCTVLQQDLNTLLAASLDGVVKRLRVLVITHVDKLKQSSHILIYRNRHPACYYHAC